MSTFRNIFLTVGTTEFDDLIVTLDNSSFVDALIAIGCKQLTVQIGRGTAPGTLPRVCEEKGIQCVCYRFKPDLMDDMQRADLIISHCGAGSILEATNLRKALVVVVNASLQGNHQTELSDALAADGHCLSTKPCDLRRLLFQLATGDIKQDAFCRPLPDARLDLFPAAIDSLFCFV